MIPQSGTTPSCDLTVYYDGNCPLCRREIDFYRKRSGAEQIAWVNLATAPDEALPNNIDRETLEKRFHVTDRNDTVLSGASAFFAVWQAMPTFKLLGALQNVPGVIPFAEFAYTQFLKVRPRLQKWADR